MASTSSWKISTDDDPQTVTWQRAIFDLGNIQTGWGIFNKGEAPEWIMDSSLTRKAARPQDGREWKRGFKLNLFSESAFGGVREFATTATGAGLGISALYEQYEVQHAAHPNKVPVVEYTGATPTRIGKGNTNIPNFKIAEWLERPATLNGSDCAPSTGNSGPPANIAEAATQNQAPLSNEASPGPDDPIDL